VKGVDRPYFRCIRPGIDGNYSEGGRSEYVRHPGYAPDGGHFIRAYEILLSDLRKLFEYIEPADANESAFSYRCLELLVRACGEVEANCKAILQANGYKGRPADWDMRDFRRLQPTHRLSKYRVRFPVWRGDRSVRVPFLKWDSNEKLTWFDAHHGCKHNRHEEFPRANLEHVVDAVSGVLVLLSSQFLTDDFGPQFLTDESGLGDGFEFAVGGYLAVRLPDDWPDEERYDFRWHDLAREELPFRCLF
jgi:hypothetical protein